MTARRLGAMASDDLERVLGADLFCLASGLDSAVRRVTPITGVRAPTLSRATFRLDLVDGTRLKGRRMERPEHARRVFDLAVHLDAGVFPRPIAIHGTALLEPWIDGREASPDEPADVLARCGAALGALHATTFALHGAGASWQPERRLGDVLTRLQRLTETGDLSRRSTARLARIAEDGLPDVVTTGVIHRDLWPRNVVIDARGTAWVVDNGNVSLGAHGYDLARTRYLWPMTHEQAAAFAGGYVATGGPPVCGDQFWDIDVLSDAALWRRLAGVRGVSRPIAFLGRLAGAS